MKVSKAVAKSSENFPISYHFYQVVLRKSWNSQHAYFPSIKAEGWSLGLGIIHVNLSSLLRSAAACAFMILLPVITS